MGSMDDENVFLRDVTAGEQEYARSLLRGARVLYLAKVTKVEDRKLMRANRQLLSLFQLQYGLSPQMRYEFMKTMTTHALLGLRRENPRDALPDPAALRTADATFFEAELPGVKARVRRDFAWRFPSLAASATAGEVKRLLNKGLKRMAAGKWDFNFDDDD